MNIVTQALRAVAEFFGWARVRSEQKNTAAVVQAKTAQQAAERKAEIEDAIEKQDADATRRIIS